MEAARRQWERDGLTTFDFAELPECLDLGTGTYAFPALVRQEDGRAGIRVFATQAEAVEAGRGGLVALYGAHFGGELAVLRKDLAPGRDQWPLFEGLGSQAAVARDFLEFVLTEAFEARDGRSPDRTAFLARVEALKGGGLFRRARFLQELVLGVLAERRQTLDLLVKYQRGPAAGSPALQAARRCLEALVPVDFLRTLAAARLLDLPRHLKALRIRIERARVSPQKDAEKEAQVLPHEDRLAGRSECHQRARCRRASRCTPATPNWPRMVPGRSKPGRNSNCRAHSRVVGTSFLPPFTWAERQDRQPDLLVYFTDAQGEFPAHEPAFPVLWLVKGRSPVPWGHRVQLN